MKIDEGAKKLFNLRNAACRYLFLGCVIVFVACSLFSGPSTSEEIKVKARDLAREDFRVRLFLYERYSGRSTWTVLLQWSPRVATIWNELTDLYIFHDGKNYKRANYMTDAVQVGGNDVRSSKEFYLKFKTWGGKEIGPFKYELNYRKFAQEYRPKY
jgi:hypothetical protein